MKVVFRNFFVKIVIKEMKKREVGRMYIDTLDTRAVCYYDIGNGYNETEKMYAAYEREGNIFSAEFKLPKYIKSVRIDPCLIGLEPIWYSDLKINGSPVEYEEYNILEVNGKKCLCKKIPYFVLKEAVSDIKFEITFGDMDITDLRCAIKDMQ